MPVEITEELLRAIATKEKALSDGRTLARKGAIQRAHRTADDQLLWGDCQGSGAKPYLLSVDLVGDSPTIRCTCPVKPPPCKHAFGLLVAFLEQKGKFAVAEPPAELAEKRTKLVERAEKRAEAAQKPRQVNTAALEKKRKAQRDALDLLETIAADIAASGLGTIDGARAARLREQARQMTDAYLPGAAIALKRLATLASGGDEKGEGEEIYYRMREPGDDLDDDDRHRLMTRHLVRIWAMVKKGQKVLDERLEEGAHASQQDDTDAVVEDLLGRVWELADLRARGSVKKDARYLELADERYDDRVREERIEQGFLLDLDSGQIAVDQRFRPFRAGDRIPEKESYERVLTLSEAAVYPGFANRRVRWELSAYRSRPIEAADWARVRELATPIDRALASFKEQLKNPLAPDDAVVLLAAKQVARAGASLVLVDEKAARLALRNSPVARSVTTNNLEMAAGAMLDGGALRQPASILARLWLGLDDHAVYGQPLALVVGSVHLRLGM